MGYEPTTECRVCGDAFDVYMPPEDRVCDSCKENENMTEIETLRAENERLRKALTDIAQGNVPFDFITEQTTKESFREKFPTWLQTTARDALAATKK